MKNYDMAVIHIPHSSVYIPKDCMKYFVADEELLQTELYTMADLYTDEIYQQDGFSHYAVAKVSRLVCDMERFRNDKDEKMSLIGMGAVYKRTMQGKPLKRFTSKEREELLNRFYDPHHAMLTKTVDDILEKHGKCLIIDGHSFGRQPLPWFKNHKTEWADFCIGTDDYHTPPALAETLKNAMEAKGYSVEYNVPFAGALVPMKHYGNDKRVTSIMIEINSKLYLEEANSSANWNKSSDFELIKELIGEWMELLYTEFEKGVV